MVPEFSELIFGISNKCSNGLIVFESSMGLTTFFLFSACDKSHNLLANSSVRPKPLFWFRSDTKTETQIG